MSPSVADLPVAAVSQEFNTFLPRNYRITMEKVQEMQRKNGGGKEEGSSGGGTKRSLENDRVRPSTRWPVVWCMREGGEETGGIERATRLRSDCVRRS